MAETHEVEGQADFSTARTLLDDIRDVLDGLDGQHRNVEGNNKKRAGHSAAISREILYAAHLAKTLELAILNEWHAFKGQSVPSITP
jgi:hypothetical protein